MDFEIRQDQCWRGHHGQVVMGAGFAAFSLVGMTINFYWGLLFAPLLPAGIAAVPQLINALWQRARDQAPSSSKSTTSSS